MASPPLPNRTLADLENFEDIDKWWPTDDQLLLQLLKDGVLTSNPRCIRCGKSMKARFRHNALEVWRCRGVGARGARDCSSRSILTGSWFANSSLPLRVVVKFLYLWAQGANNAVLKDVLHLSGVTIIHYKELCRQICSRIIRTQKLGGSNNPVIVGDFAMKTKQSRGAGVVGPTDTYIFAGLEMGTLRCFAEKVERSLPQYLDVLNQYLATDTTVTYLSCVPEGFEIDSYENVTASDRLMCEFVQYLRDSFRTGHNVHDRLLEGWLHELVIRRTEGDFFFKRIVKELMRYPEEDLSRTMTGVEKAQMDGVRTPASRGRKRMTENTFIPPLGPPSFEEKGEKSEISTSPPSVFDKVPPLRLKRLKPPTLFDVREISSDGNDSEN